jgi:hypothetical protein
MSSTPFSATYTTNQTISIPSNASGVVITAAGARGGRGGDDANASGANGGNGRIGTFTLSSFTARTLTIDIGTIGANGQSNANNGANTPGGVGVATGGAGGRSGPSGASGCGGGGGGATGVYDSVANAWIIVSGGGGGGGGAAFPGVPGLPGDSAGIYTTPLPTISNGGAGGNCPTDGSGGGGGGAGASGGGGGNNGFDVSVGNVRAGGGAGGGSGYNSTYATLNSFINTNGGNGYVTVSYNLITPEIGSFSASPNPQTSGTDGVPRYNTSLTWSTTDTTSVSINQGVGSVSAAGTVAVSNLSQSIVGSASPATKNYTLTACAGTVCVSDILTVASYNDNTPSSITVPTTTTTNVSLNSLEPNTQYQIEVGPIGGIDMKTSVVCNTVGLQASVNQSNWSSQIVIDPNSTFYLRFFSVVFNTDPNGATNSKTFGFSVGTSTSSFTATTRAPDVNETFDMGDSTTSLPYPDIDLIAGGPNQYIQSPTVLTVNDVEIDVEIKTDKPDAQIRITPSGGAAGSWIDVRQI